MTLVSPLTEEEAKANSMTDMPVLREIIHDLRESVASFAQSSNTSLPNEDILIQEALALPSGLEVNLPTQGSNITVDTNSLTDNLSDTILDALLSSGKRISIALNSATSEINLTSEVRSIDDNSVREVSSNINIQATSTVLTSAQQVSTKKQHIMISYNRSCENTCRQIRNQLKKLKYKVWMDVYDMHDNFIDGMAKAIRNSYIVLICINREYYNSFWCKKEAEDIAIQQIKFIPCFMEEPFPLEDWLGFLVGANVWVDFSKGDRFHESFEKLIKEITVIEQTLPTIPRETPPSTPTTVTMGSFTANSTIATFDAILGNFKTWVEANRHNLKRLNRNQSAKLINQLTEALQNDNSTSDDQNKQEFLQQLLLSTTQDENEGFTRLINNSIASNYPMIKGLICIMTLWAVRVVFQKK